MKSSAAMQGRGPARGAGWARRIAGVAIAIAAVSCASTAPPTDTTVTTTETTTTVTKTAAPSLASTNWKVVEVRGAATPWDRSTATLVFDSAGRVTGTTGCNNYTSTVTYAGTDITFAPVVVTRITCTDTTGLDVERRYLEDFAVLKAYELNSSGELLLKDVNGTTVVRLSRVP
jgi:heat shock protein HslJ